MGQPAIAIPEKIFFKIGEVCDIVDVQAHVLRYWETEFPMLSPQKNRSGQRSYRRRDVEIALRIKELLYDDLYTIAGAKKKLQSEMRETSRLKIVHSEPKEREYLKPVEMPPPAPIEEENIEIEDFDTESEEVYAEHEDFNEAFQQENFVMDDNRQEALKSLAAQLLELREMLKTNQTREAEQHLRRF
ncbi:MAG: putative transcriptional regulator [Acidobacteria bacterium]|jgi:DNA-binding transcriptional MerR regulator|nr:putative transcriptional regulator [Acidobacteriota bacterium]